jgi:drug/metabolite transporter (DMT)-like permease
MAVGAAACWGIGTAFSKYALKGTSYLHVSTLRFAMTTVFALLFVLASGSSAALGQMTWEQFGYLIAITFSTGMVALLIYYYGLQKITASRSAILELVWPLSSVAIGWLFLHQGLTITQAIGAVLLIGTTYSLTKSDKSTTDGSDIIS